MPDDPELEMNALRMGRLWRKPPPGLLRHSDRGSQYCSADYQALLGEYGVVTSMSRKAIAGTTHRWKASSTV
jgi:putative transposase